MINRAREASVALLGFVLLLDLLWSLTSASASNSEFGAVDEPAHLATALLFLIALVVVLRSQPTAAFALAAVVASVALDLDHIPAYLGWHGLTDGVPRPYTHSLVTPVVLLLAGALAGSRASQISLGAAFGVGAHLARDVATGPGVALLWPLSSATVKLPYLLFAAALVLATAVVLAATATRVRGSPAKAGARAISP